MRLFQKMQFFDLRNKYLIDWESLIAGDFNCIDIYAMVQIGCCPIRISNQYEPL